MAPPELQTALQRLRLSPEELALYLSIKPGRVADWQEGRRSIPTGVAARLRWLLTALDRENTLNRLGPPVCDWLQQWEDHAPPVSDLPATFTYLQQREDHRLTCDACRSREALAVSNHLELPPRPLSPFEHLIRPLPAGGITSWPVLLGLCAFGLIALIPIAFGALATPSASGKVARVITDCLLSALAGAVAGSVFAAARPLAARLDRLRHPVEGIMLVGSYLAGAILASEVLFGSGRWTWSPGLWIAWMAVSLVLGSIVGHQLLRPEPASRTGAV